MSSKPVWCNNYFFTLACINLGRMSTQEDTQVSIHEAFTHEDTQVSTCVDTSTGVATQVTTFEDFLRCVLTFGPPRGPHSDWAFICPYLLSEIQNRLTEFMTN